MRGGDRLLSVLGWVEVLPPFLERGEKRVVGVATLEVGGALPVVTPESRRQLANGLVNSCCTKRSDARSSVEVAVLESLEEGSDDGETSLNGRDFVQKGVVVHVEELQVSEPSPPGSVACLE